MSHTCLIKAAPCFSGERYLNPSWARPDRALYEKLRFLPSQQSAPLLVNHDESRVIGTIGAPFRLEWTDGYWFAVRAEVTDPPSWLRRGTPVSLGSKWLHQRDPELFDQAEVVADALVREVSVLSPDRRPAEPLAEVLTFRPAEPPKVLTLDEEVDAILRLPAARQLDAIQERARDRDHETALIIAAQNRLTSSLDKAYGDWVAAGRPKRRTTVPKVAQSYLPA